jgi:hypothetical protein
MTPLEHAIMTRMEMNETNDCSVLALAMACRIDYHLSHVALKMAGRKNRQGVFPEHIKKATENLGFSLGPRVCLLSQTQQRKGERPCLTL